MKAAKILIVVLMGFSMVSVSHSVTRANLNTDSARLNALQMTVAIKDHTNKIGLDQYGGNPAGILLDEEKNRIVPGVKYQSQSYSGNQSDLYQGSLLTIFRNENIAFRFEGLGSMNDTEFVGGATTDTDTGQLEAAYNQRFGKFLIGGQLNYFNNDYSSSFGSHSFYHTDPLSYVLGMALVSPLSSGSQIHLGIDFGQDRTESRSRSPELINDEYGIELVLNNENSDLGIILDLNESESKYSSLKSDQSAANYKMRGFLNPGGGILQMGAEYQFSDSESETTYVTSTSNNSKSNSNSHTGKAGIALKMNEKNLVGVEGQITKTDSNFHRLSGASASYTDILTSKLSAGAEFGLGMILGRISFSYQDYDSDLDSTSGAFSSDFFINTFATGIGIPLGNEGMLDLLYQYQESKLAPSTFTFTNEIRALATIFFGA